MITDLENYFVGFVIGIRYRANFSIEDSLGEIVDKILYSKKSYFGPKKFPLVQNHVNSKVLVNQETNDKLTINNSNIVLDISFSETFQKSDYNSIIAKFNDEIIDGVMKKYKITEINRIGLVKRYLFDLDELANSFIDKTIGKTLEGVNDINLQFSKKFPTAEGLVKEDVYDYTNAIFNIIKHSDAKELFMSIDYQKYFDPFLTNCDQMKFMDFSKSVDGFNTKNYLPWLNKNYLD